MTDCEHVFEDTGTHNISTVEIEHNYKCLECGYEYNEVENVKNTHCQSCGEWLEGFDTCSECGREN